MITDPAARLQTAFSDAIARTLGEEFTGTDPSIRASNKPELGDFQCNAAMGLAKRVGQQPRALAESLLANVRADDVVETLEIAGPGFINIKLRLDAIAGAVEAMDTPTLGVIADEHIQTIVIDLCGVNVAKQMHVGHLRSTIIGDALARVLTRLGHDVHRENHLGDWGLPIAMVLDTLRRDDVDLSQITLTNLDTAYRRGQAAARGDEKGLKAAVDRHVGPHRIAELETQQESAQDARSRAGELLVSLQDGNAEIVKDWHRIIDITLEAVAEALDLLNIDMGPENNRGESFYRDKLSAVLETFQGHNACREDGGALVVDFPTRERPMLIRKSDGGFLYATTDLAAIRCRTQDTGASRCIYVVDARQRDHFRDVFDAAAQVGWNQTPSGELVDFIHTPFGSVLGADRRPLKTRSGANVTLASLLQEAIQRGRDEVRRRAAEPGSPTHDLSSDELDSIGRAVGIGAIKYADLSNDLSRDYVFDLDRMVSFEGDTGPYLQYACARIQSMLRRAGDLNPTASLMVNSPTERQLSLALLRWNTVVHGTGQSLEPHRIAVYLRELAEAFNRFYQECPVLKAESPAIQASRLRLVSLTGRVLADGLSLLGIETPACM
jgi:arginyl-tRNA synthetase